MQEIPANEASSSRVKTINQRGGGGNNTEAMVRSARSHETLELITGENELGETLLYLLPHYCPLF